MVILTNLLSLIWDIFQKTFFSSNLFIQYLFYIGIFNPEGELISAHLLRCVCMQQFSLDLRIQVCRAQTELMKSSSRTLEVFKFQQRSYTKKAVKSF